jgi:hypothetical protein
MPTRGSHLYSHSCPLTNPPTPPTGPIMVSHYYVSVGVCVCACAHASSSVSKKNRHAFNNTVTTVSYEVALTAYRSRIVMSVWCHYRCSPSSPSCVGILSHVCVRIRSFFKTAHSPSDFLMGLPADRKNHSCMSSSVTVGKHIHALSCIYS